MEIGRDFKNLTQKEKESVFNEMLDYKDKIHNEHLKLVCNRLLYDNKEELFKRSAGHDSLLGEKNTGTHHFYDGGLLVHLKDVTQIAYKVACMYDGLDLDLVIFGGLIHDIGKIYIFDEYKVHGDIHGNLNEKYMLVDHMYIGMKMVEDCIESTKQEIASELWLSDNAKYQVLHIIGSHMDTMKKHMVEAYIVSYADSMDAYVTNLLTYERNKRNPSCKDWIFKSSLGCKTN